MILYFRDLPSADENTTTVVGGFPDGALYSYLPVYSPQAACLISLLAFKPVICDDIKPGGGCSEPRQFYGTRENRPSCKPTPAFSDRPSVTGIRWGGFAFRSKVR